MILWEALLMEVATFRSGYKEDFGCFHLSLLWRGKSLEQTLGKTEGKQRIHYLKILVKYIDLS